MARLQLVIFDCDGVLVDSETLTNKIFLKQLAEDGLEISISEFMNEFVGHTMVEATRKMHQKYNYQLTEDFFKRFHISSLRILATDLEPIPGIHEAIDNLTVPFCMASNSAPDKIEVMLKKTELWDRFKGNIFSSKLVPNPKPAPDIYLLAAESHQTAVQNCLVIEDTSVGVTAAVAAGMTVFGYAAASDPKKLLDAGAKLVFNRMSELDGLIKTHFVE
ncbi:MAG: HAD family hydrolase [Methylophilaceae bacterium]|jgi:HAD superfamily hydrolase (TIGR01509 family)|nr:HAD family hydrolase [Methyloradius sp.]